MPFCGGDKERGGKDATDWQARGDIGTLQDENTKLTTELHQLKASMQSQMDDVRREMQQLRQARDEELMSGSGSSSRNVGVESNGNSGANNKVFEDKITDLKVTTEAKIFDIQALMSDDGDRLDQMEEQIQTLIKDGPQPAAAAAVPDDDAADLQSLRDDFSSIKETIEAMEAIRGDFSDMEEHLEELAERIDPEEIERFSKGVQEKLDQHSSQMAQINEDFKAIQEAVETVNHLSGQFNEFETSFEGLAEAVHDREDPEPATPKAPAAADGAAVEKMAIRIATVEGKLEAFGEALETVTDDIDKNAAELGKLDNMEQQIIELRADQVQPVVETVMTLPSKGNKHNDSSSDSDDDHKRVGQNDIQHIQQQIDHLKEQIKDCTRGEDASAAPDTQHMSAVMGRLEKLEGSIEHEADKQAHEAQVQMANSIEHEADKQAHEAQLTKALERVTECEGQLEAIQDAIVSNEATAEDNQKGIDEVKGLCQEVGTDIRRLEEIESGLKSVEHKVEGMSALQNSTEEGLAAMQAMAEKVEGIKMNMEELEESIGELAATVQDSDGGVDDQILETMKSDFDGLRVEVTQVQAMKTELNEKITQLSQQLVGVEGVVEGLTEEFSPVEDQLEAMGEHLEELEAKVNHLAGSDSD